MVIETSLTRITTGSIKIIINGIVFVISDGTGDCALETLKITDSAEPILIEPMSNNKIGIK